MPKDIVIIPASGQIEFSGSSTPATNHTILTTNSSSVELSAFGNGFLFEWMPLIGLNNTSIKNKK